MLNEPFFSLSETLTSLISLEALFDKQVTFRDLLVTLSSRYVSLGFQSPFKTLQKEALCTGSSESTSLERRRPFPVTKHEAFLTVFSRCPPSSCFLAAVHWEVNHQKFSIASLGGVRGTVTALKENKALRGHTGREGGLMSFPRLP